MSVMKQLDKTICLHFYKQYSDCGNNCNDFYLIYRWFWLLYSHFSEGSAVPEILLNANATELVTQAQIDALIADIEAEIAELLVQQANVEESTNLRSSPVQESNDVTQVQMIESPDGSMCCYILWTLTFFCIVNGLNS